MTTEGPLSVGERFRHLEKRMDYVEKRITELRIDSARQQLKLAISVGIANLIAFGIVEFLAVWLNHSH